MRLVSPPQLTDLAEGTGWDAEFGRDAWQMHRLGFEGRRVLDFSGIPQPELKDLAKRWIRWRLSTGLGLDAGGTAASSPSPGSPRSCRPRHHQRPASIDRAILEDYLADLHAAMAGRRQHGVHVSMIGLFLTAVRQHGWDPALPPDAMLFPGDQPRRPRSAAPGPGRARDDPGRAARQPRPPEQPRLPAGHAHPHPLRPAGLRRAEAALDCAVTDDSGASYLRYRNHKMKREALVPIDDELLALIRGQQQRILGRYPSPAVLFPRPAKTGREDPSAARLPARALPLAGRLRRPRRARAARASDSPSMEAYSRDGLINRDVPQHVVQKILDHDSPEMTAHYARLSDKTVREHWERARKVNADGQPVQLSPDGPLGDAAWAKQQLSRATQSLPNGYCQLPLVKTCPHANTCLTCPMFVTTAEFLPQHHAQRQATLQIITAAEATGHARVAEMNRQVAGNLDKIITALEAGSRDERRRPPVRPDPLTEAAARRHELTRAKAIQALRELDRAGMPVTFAAVATAAGISRSWLYTQPDISDQIRSASAGNSPARARPAPSPPASGPPKRRCAPGSPPPSTATSSSPTRTPGSAASSPARSATSEQLHE